MSIILENLLDTKIKYEDSNSVICCQCCYDTNRHKLRNMREPYCYENKYEIYANILHSCYDIKIIESKDSAPMICENCVIKLRDAYAFKLQVETTQCKLNNNVEDISNHFTENENKNIINVKEELDMDDYSLNDIFNESSNEITKLKETEQFKEKSDGDILIDEFVIKNRKKLKKKRQKLKKHSKDIIEEKFICNTCNEGFESKRLLSRHMKDHPQLFICHICGRESATKKLLLSHVISHNTEKIQCKVCNKFLKKGSMLRHVQQHSGNTYSYPCKLCPEKFPSYNTRLYHLAVAHGMNEKKYSCKICDKSFRFSGGLSTHIKRCHLQEKKCVCIECGKSLFSKNELLNHMLKHTKLRTFQCEVCLKSYGRKSTLQSHMKIHNNVKAYKCEICFRDFTQKCTLMCHMKVHEKMNSLQLLQEK